MRMLGLDPYDWAIQVEVVNEAQRLHVEERRNEIKVLSEAIGGQVAKRIGKQIGAAIRFMGRR